MDAIAVAILSALAGSLVWMAQRYFERQATERLRKEELYRALLAASVEFVTSGNGAPFVIESQRAWLYASDEVLAAINDYLKAFAAHADSKTHGGDSTETWAAVKDAEGRLRLSIRKDLRPKTKITGHWVKGRMGDRNSPSREIKGVPWAKLCVTTGGRYRLGTGIK